MIKIFVEVDGKTVTAEISESTYEILRDGAILRNRPIKWFLTQIIKIYGKLTEENIIQFMDEKWII